MGWHKSKIASIYKWMVPNERHIIAMVRPRCVLPCRAKCRIRRTWFSVKTIFWLSLLIYDPLTQLSLPQTWWNLWCYGSTCLHGFVFSFYVYLNGQVRTEMYCRQNISTCDSHLVFGDGDGQTNGLVLWILFLLLLSFIIRIDMNGSIVWHFKNMWRINYLPVLVLLASFFLLYIVQYNITYHFDRMFLYVQFVSD